MQVSITPVSVKAIDGYKIWIKFSDGNEGEIDLSRFAGDGVFKDWEDRSHFESVSIAPSGFISWGDEIDLCPEGLYSELTGKTWHELTESAEAVSTRA